MTTEAPLNTITPSQIAGLLDEHAKTQTSVIVLGPPGCGKTEIPRAWCPQSHHLVEVSLAAMTDLEFAGPTMPDPATRTAIAYQAAWYAQAMADAPDRPWLVLLDELTMASADAQRIGTSILLDKHVRGWKLPAGSMVIATGNRTSDGTRAVPVLSTLRTRGFTYSVAIDAASWLDWARRTGVDGRVVAFIDANREMLCPPDDAGLITPDAAAPNPRTWTLLARQLAAGSLPTPALVGGAIGDTCGRAFLAFVETHHAALAFHGALSDPSNAVVPTDAPESDAAKRYLVSAIRGATSGDNVRTLVSAALTWIARWPIAEARQAAIGRLVVVCRDANGMDLTVAPYSAAIAAILANKG
jgi:hypothetical protein